MSENKWIKESPYTVDETIDRLTAILKHYPTVKIISEIDQQENAKSQGFEIHEVTTLIFQNNALIGNIIKANPKAAFELPIKATVWKEEGKVWIRTTDIDHLERAYQLNGAFGAIETIYRLLPPWLDILVSDTTIDQFAALLPGVE